MNKTITVMLALILVLMMSFAVFAEETELLVPEQNESAVTEETAEDDSTELEEAWNAYYAAKQSANMTNYEEELNAMVEAGTLTQEQADLLLKNVQDQQALRNGQCPNCGYQFSNCTGRQNDCGRKNGNRMGMRGGNGFGKGMNNGNASVGME